MVMKNYKTSVERLARIFKKGRDSWKARAAEKQKKLRALEIKVRDLSNSRDYWKERAKAAEEERKNEQKSVVSHTQENLLVGEVVKEGELVTEENLEAPHCHVYPLFVMRLAIESVINVLTGFRGGKRNLEMISGLIQFSTPSMSTVRYWTYRLGYYLLQKKPSYHTDWIVIADLTATLGKLKCLLVIGIPQSKLSNGLIELPLQHHDVEILGLEVLNQSTGEIIAEKLENITKEIGIVSQIIADHGSDIKKGIELYQQNHPDVINTYDVTHKMALLLKDMLDKDERYQSFINLCNSTTQSIQQTELQFLKPNNQRTKSRWLNLDILICWAQSVLDYQMKGDFSLISQNDSINTQAMLILQNSLPTSLGKSLSKLMDNVYPTWFSFYRAVINEIGQKAVRAHRKDILEAASIGRQRFQEKLGWLNDYKNDINVYMQLINMVKLASEQIKHEGLHEYSADYFSDCVNDLSPSSSTKKLKEQIIDYMNNEINFVRGDETASKVDNNIIPASSDIIESLFGKYKQFLKTSPLNEISKMVLMLPLLVTTITNDLIKKAMENVRTADLEKWANEVLGASSLAKRREAFGHP